MSIKKIVIFSILGLILLYIGYFYFRYMFVPSGQEFDIKFVNLIKKDVKGRANPELSELTNSGFKTRTTFMNSNDGVEYLFDVVNDGTIDAVLKYDPIYLKLDQYFKKHVEYKITYLDATPVKKGDELKAGETKTIRVSIIYSNPEFESQDAQFYESNTWLVYLKK